MTQFVIILYEAAAIIYDPERGMALRVPRIHVNYTAWHRCENYLISDAADKSPKTTSRGGVGDGVGDGGT